MELLLDRIQRIARTETSGIRQRIKKDSSYTDAVSVHRIRISVKKMRALLRLIRDQMGDKLYHKQTEAWSAVATSVAPLRNLEIQLKTLCKVCRHNSRRVSSEEFANLWRSLLKEREKHLAEAVASKKQLKRKLRSALHGIKSWPLKGLKGRDLRLGINKSYHRFMKAYEKAKSLPTVGNLHVWRKRTKDLTYQLEMIKRLGAKPAGKLLGKLMRLGKALGDDHDLALLKLKADKFDPHVSKEFQKSVRLRQAELQQSAFELGGKLSMIKAAAFDLEVKSSFIFAPTNCRHS
jgi:CHAD domain-containing protein